MNRLVAAAFVAVLVAGCGAGSRSSDPGPTAPSSGTSEGPAQGPSPLALRVVLRSSDPAAGNPSGQPTAPASWLARFDSYRCGTGVVGGPTDYQLACDAAKTKYLLAPATWFGHPKRATAADHGAWAVAVSLDSTGASALAKLSREMYLSGGRVALLVGTELVAVPGFDGVITDGSIQITGGLTKATAHALADRLTGS